MEEAKPRTDGEPTTLAADVGPSWLGRIRRLLRTWAARELEREYLLKLDDGQLWSMHLTREDARQLARKPFWRE